MTVIRFHGMSRASGVALTALGGAALLLPAFAFADAGRREIRPAPRRFAHRESRPAAVADSAPIVVLQRLLQAETSLAFQATQITTVSRNGLDISSEQRVLRNGAQAIRIDYTRPDRLAGESIVDNGKFYWHYRPKNNTLEVGASRIERLRKKIHGVIEQARRGTLIVTIQGQDTVASRPCTIIDVRPGNGRAGPWRRLWVDVETGAQLRIEQYDASGQRRSASFFTAISFSPTLAPDAFSTPGEGRHPQIKQLDDDQSFRTVAEAEAKAGFPARQPTYLPAGFRFGSASVSEFQGKKMIVLRYNNGISVVSLFQTLDDSGDAGPKFQNPRVGAVTRTQGGRKLVLVGNLSPGDLNQMITSVQ